MKYISILIAIILAVINVQADDTYLLKEEYTAPKLDLGYNYAVSPALGVAYSTRWNSDTASHMVAIFFRENNEDYLFQSEYHLPSSVSNGSLLIVEDLLIILDDSNASFFSIGNSGELTYLKTQSVSDQLPSGKTLNGEIIKAGQDQYILKQSGYMHLITINAMTQSVTILDTLDFLEQDENVVSTVSHIQYQLASNTLWLFKNTNALYRFEQLALSNQTLESVQQYSYTFDAGFDYVNEAGIYYAHQDASANAVIIQNYRRTFIFQLDEIAQSVSLELSQLHGNDRFLTGSADTDEQIIARDGNLYLVNVDWNNYQPSYTNTQISSAYPEYDFITGTVLLGQDTINAQVEFYSLQQGILTSSDLRLTSELGRALPKRLIDSQFDRQTGRLAIIGSESSTTTAPMLYIWQYHEATDSAEFLAASLILSAEMQPEFYNFEIIGANGDYFYLYTKSNDTIQSQVRVYYLQNDELQLVQNYDLSGNAELSINDHLFVADNKIAFFPYIPSSNSYFVRLCDVMEDGLISGCSDQGLFNDRLFHVSSSDFQLKQLANSEQLLFAPRQTIYKMTEQDISTWILKYNPDSGQIETIQTLENPSDETKFYPLNSGFTYNQGQLLYLYYDQAYLHQWNQNTSNWESVDNVSGIRYPTSPMATAEASYFINEDGHAYLLDSAINQFYRSDQDVNLGDSNSTYQITMGNKGYVLDIGSSSRLMTFELMDTTPFYYKGDMSIGNIEALQDAQFNVDIGQYFLNNTDDSIELLIDGLTVDELQNPRISWDGAILSGTLNNEDMFNGPSSSQEADDFFVRISYDNASIDTFRIMPVNVNDAPELIQQIGTQSLEPGQAYEGSFGGYVVDPDREYVTYSYENMPTGMTGTDDGMIQGSITNEGSYSITVTATDPNGASLVFDINIVVQRVTTPPPVSSGGGGGGGTMNWLVMLLLSAYLYSRGRETYQR